MSRPSAFVRSYLPRNTTVSHSGMQSFWQYRDPSGDTVWGPLRGADCEYLARSEQGDYILAEGSGSAPSADPNEFGTFGTAPPPAWYHTPQQEEQSISPAIQYSSAPGSVQAQDISSPTPNKAKSDQTYRCPPCTEKGLDCDLSRSKDTSHKVLRGYKFCESCDIDRMSGGSDYKRCGWDQIISVRRAVGSAARSQAHRQRQRDAAAGTSSGA